MISKLIAWAEDRPAAIARMRRALDEYVISGIRTTLPFFSWLLASPSSSAGAFTRATWTRCSRSETDARLSSRTAEQEEIAAIAAAVHAMLSSAARHGEAGPGVERRWKSQARAEGLRE